MELNLAQYKYTLVIDKSGSMSICDQPNGSSRWEAMAKTAYQFAEKIESIGADKMDLYLFAGKFRKFSEVSSAEIPQIFLDYEPAGGTNLAGVLVDVFKTFASRRASGKNEIILIITDGEPENKEIVVEQLVDFSQTLNNEHEIGFQFIQIGNDTAAAEFLTYLDDELVKQGARFDIVDTKNTQQIAEMSLSDVLLHALID